MSGGRYEFLESVGKGNYGTLYRGVDRGTGHPRDVLIAGKKLKQAANSRNVLRELSIQRSVGHCPHVVTLYDVVPRDTEKVLLVLELLPMNLREFMDSFACAHRQPALQALHQPLLPLPYTKLILKGLLTALEELHARSIAHRDVKPENILVEPLGLECPLRCCCPGPPSQCHVHRCWCNALPNEEEEARPPENGGTRQHDESCGNGNGNGATGGCLPHSSAPLVGSSGSAISLNHDMGAQALTRAICRLHCPRCGGGAATEEHEAVDTLPAQMPLPLAPHVKLGDFGSARSVGEVKVLPWEEQPAALTGHLTTPVYCAPEMILQHVYDEAVDLWAVGAIFFELAFGVLLLPMGRVRSIDGARIEVDYTGVHRLIYLIYLLGTPTLEEWRAIAPAEYGDSVLHALPQQHTSQLFPCDGTAGDGEGGNGHSRGGTSAADNPLAAAMPRLIGTDGVSLLRSLLRYDPRQRITAAEALRHPFFQ